MEKFHKFNEFRHLEFVKGKFIRVAKVTVGKERNVDKALRKYHFWRHKEEVNIQLYIDEKTTYRWWTNWLRIVLGGWFSSWRRGILGSAVIVRCFNWRISLYGGNIQTVLFTKLRRFVLLRFYVREVRLGHNSTTTTTTVLHKTEEHNPKVKHPDYST
jgi:hypothetical protein